MKKFKLPSKILHSKEYVSLKEHFGKIIKAVEKATTTKAKALAQNTKEKASTIEKGIKIRFNSLEKRLESMNEFRSALKDQTQTFITKSEFNILHDRLCEDVKILREDKARAEGKASWAIIISVIMALIAIASLILTVIKLF